MKIYPSTKKGWVESKTMIFLHFLSFFICHISKNVLFLLYFPSTYWPIVTGTFCHHGLAKKEKPKSFWPEDGITKISEQFLRQSGKFQNNLGNIKTTLKPTETLKSFGIIWTLLKSYGKVLYSPDRSL